MKRLGTVTIEIKYKSYTYKHKLMISRDENWNPKVTNEKLREAGMRAMSTMVNRCEQLEGEKVKKI